jgi:hypothetical protein
MQVAESLNLSRFRGENRDYGKEDRVKGTEPSDESIIIKEAREEIFDEEPERETGNIHPLARREQSRTKSTRRVSRYRFLPLLVFFLAVSVLLGSIVWERWTVLERRERVIPSLETSLHHQGEKLYQEEKTFVQSPVREMEHDSDNRGMVPQNMATYSRSKEKAPVHTRAEEIKDKRVLPAGKEDILLQILLRN